MTLRIALVAAAFLCISQSAQAAVLCANPSGSVFLRAACKANETLVDPATLGLGGSKALGGFVYKEGTQFGSGFTITKIAPGKFELRIPASNFSKFPAIGVSGWGLPGFLPTVNVVYNTFEAATNSYLAEIWVSAPDGVTLVDWGFQFVAAEVQ